MRNVLVATNLSMLHQIGCGKSRVVVRRASCPSFDTAIAAEIDAYTKEKKLKRIDDDDKLTNPLAWWKERRIKYPLLIKLKEDT